MVAIQLRHLDVPPGQSLLLCDVNWAEFEAILAELGDRRRARIRLLPELIEAHRSLGRLALPSERTWAKNRPRQRYFSQHNDT